MDPLILLRRLGGPVFALNPDLIERAESTPDTVITMVGGNKYLVCESLDELTELIRDHRSQIIAAAEAMAISAPPPVGSADRGARLHEVSHVPATVVSIRSKDV
ncbi:MAG TPA: flagellar FlbD family protein [Jatrophihabitans sp.]|jgi:flagellar protein FlbD